MGWLNGGIANLAEEICESYTPDEKEDFPYIGLEHVEPQSLRLCSIGSSLDVKSQKWRFRRGDILFGTLRPYFRKVIRANFDGVCSTEFSVIRPKMHEDSEFIFYFVSHPEFIEYATTNSKGDRPRTKWELFSKFAAPIPPLHIRKRLGSILGNYDDLIANNYRRIALLEKSARLLYKEWFVRLRFPGHKHAPIINGIPKGWEQGRLEQALILQRGFDLPAQNRVEGDIPIYASTGQAGFHNKAMVRGPGVVTGRSGTLGVVKYVSEDFWPLNTTLWVKEFKRVTPVFAYFLLTELQLEQYNGGVSVPTLDRKVVHRLPIPIPNRNLIDLFDDYINPFFTLIRTLLKQNEKLKIARDLLLPRLMSGEIAV